MDFDGCASAQGGLRPGLVFQNNVGNNYSPNIIALPLTSQMKKCNQPTHVLVRANDTGLIYDSMVLCENPERMPKEKVGAYITTLSDEYMERVAEASLLATSAISFIDLDKLITLWHKANNLNAA